MPVPSRSLTFCAGTETVYVVEYARFRSTTMVSTEEAYEEVPETAAPRLSVRRQAIAEAKVESISVEKVTEIVVAVMGTSAALVAGLVDTTVGRTRGCVVKVQV